MKKVANHPDKRKVVLGFSGGVDSTAAALLLKDGGYEVAAVYLDVLGGNSEGFGAALEIAEQLGIDLLRADVSDAFGETVIADFCGEYMKGRTPNPCVLCNPMIKFKQLLKIADELGAQFVATGHYAGTHYDQNEDCYFINKAKSAEKDQSYMLYRLNQRIVSRLLLPLGHFESKEEVRNYAASKGMANAGRKDSQEICFMPEGMHYTDYLEMRGHHSENGDFVDVNGKIIGTHMGIHRYTTGQRKNLGAAFGKPMYVVSLDHEKNHIVLGGRDELFSAEAVSKNNWFAKSDGNELPVGYDGLIVSAKVRYAAAAAEAVICRAGDDAVKAVFSTPQRAVAPGQSIVFYVGGNVIGGGIIEQ